MKYLKDYKLFENVDFPTDKGEIEKICKLFDIENYTIHKDGTVDVNDDVNLKGLNLPTIPLKFGVVSGFFYCSENKLTSLEGCPTECAKFDCGNNKLTSLEFAPEKVEYGFMCRNNLIHSPDSKFLYELNRALASKNASYAHHIISNNPIFQVMWVFKKIDYFLKSLDYNYFMGGNKIHESRFLEACDDLKFSAPDNIEGYVWV